MSTAGAKRGSDEDVADGSAKRSRTEGDAQTNVTVYQPNVVIPDLAKKMNSLIEVSRREHMQSAHRGPAS